MVKAAAAAGLLDERAAVLEALTGIRRAGADIVITYHAKDVADGSCSRPEGPQPQGRRRDPARRDRQAAAEPHAGPLPARRAAVRGASPRLAGLPEDEVLARVQRLLDQRIIREITPIFDTRALGYQSMLVAAKVDARAPAPRRAGHQLAPGRHAQLPAQPRLQPVVHARRRARLAARHAGHARRHRGAHAAPSRSASCRR